MSHFPLHYPAQIFQQNICKSIFRSFICLHSIAVYQFMGLLMVKVQHVRSKSLQVCTLRKFYKCLAHELHAL